MMLILAYYLELTLSQSYFVLFYGGDILRYSISKAAERTRLTTHTLRYYDKEGLIPFVERNASGVRVFQEKDFVWIELISCMKASGMSIKEIKLFIDRYMEGDSTIGLRRDMFYERKKIVEEQIESLKKTLDMLVYKCWFYDVAAMSGSTTFPKQMALEEMPEEIRNIKRKIDL